MMDEQDFNGTDLVQVPIDGVLDLHNFSPKDLKYLIPDYLEECCKADIFQVRIIHGKGIGNLRRTVHAILKKLPQVIEFRLAGENAGGWGATLVQLRKKCVQ
jgi:dsDNA-specific endonuclease/ATPase MutS2